MYSKVFALVFVITCFFYTCKKDENIDNPCQPLTEIISLSLPETVFDYDNMTVPDYIFTAPFMHDGRFASLEEVLKHVERL